jgi:flagellar biosynthetic protein FliR
MSIDAGLFYAFLLVFVRCSAMLFSSPLFGAQNVPLQVRIFTTMALAGALTFTVKANIGQPPADMWTLVMAVGHEIVAGLLIGVFMSLILQAAEMAGSFIDLQMGLSSSQALNPVTGVSVSIIAQFKYMLGLVIFLNIDGHHVMLNAFVHSYEAMPAPTVAMLPSLQTSFVGLITQLSLLALQIAAPVAAVSIVVDAAMGVINKAVPQMQIFLVGLPAKIIVGMLALTIALPALVSGVQIGVETASASLYQTFQPHHGR